MGGGEVEGSTESGSSLDDEDHTADSGVARAAECDHKTSSSEMRMRFPR